MATDGVSRWRVLLNSDPEPSEGFLGLESALIGLVFLTGNFLPNLCSGPVTVGLLATLGDDGLHVIGALLLVLAFAQWGAVANNLILTRRTIALVQTGWYLFMALQYLVAFGLLVGPVLLVVFALKAGWASWRLFRPGVRHAASAS